MRFSPHTVRWAGEGREPTDDGGEDRDEHDELWTSLHRLVFFAHPPHAPDLNNQRKQRGLHSSL
jgi:hypothetical protein